MVNNLFRNSIIKRELNQRKKSPIKKKSFWRANTSFTTHRDLPNQTTTSRLRRPRHLLAAHRQLPDRTLS